jgi:superfamily II DNA or RNA helicase
MCNATGVRDATDQRACHERGNAHSHLAGARLRTARAIFGDSLDAVRTTATLGTVTLRSDQLLALRRVQSQLARHGGCLLADDVGTGKTYVALAAARAWRRPLIVVPASLRATWRDAMQRAGAEHEIVSHESLSRGVMPASEHDGIVVDESHRFRPTSRRHAALARLSTGAQLLLLSATPLQNRTRELAAQLALFLGESAYRLETPALARYVVRDASSVTAGLPRVAPPRWLTIECDDGNVLRAILALPPPPRALDAGDGGPLLTISLVRAWASSRAALLATVRRRRQTLVAMEQCLEEGRAPSRAELRSWRGGGGVQLGFAALLAATNVERGAVAELARALGAERRGLDALLVSLHESVDPDVARVAALLSVRSAHPAASILCFSESASTVRAYYSALRGLAGVGMLTARDARIASGGIPRAELLARFAPRAQGTRARAAHERVTLLLATDLLSEGVNLQDASVVVHLDLPWNPARLAQRVGRVRRPGGADEVLGYLMTPPADAALLLRTEARLRDKLARAERTIGRGLEVVPTLAAVHAGIAHAAIAHDDPLASTAASSTSSEAELLGEIEARLAAWRRPRAAARCVRSRGRCVTAAVESRSIGWVARIDDGRIVAKLVEGDYAAGDDAAGDDAAGDAAASDGAARDASITDDSRVVARALELADGPPRNLCEREPDDAHRALAAYLAREWTRRSVGLVTVRPQLRLIALRRVERALARAPRHRRRAVLSMAARLRAWLDAPLPLGVERELARELSARNASGERAHADASIDSDESWLAGALALLERTPARAATRVVTGPGSPSALILLGPR